LPGRPGWVLNPGVLFQSLSKAKGKVGSGLQKARFKNSRVSLARPSPLHTSVFKGRLGGLKGYLGGLLRYKSSKSKHLCPFRPGLWPDCLPWGSVHSTLEPNCQVRSNLCPPCACTVFPIRSELYSLPQDPCSHCLLWTVSLTTLS
jgi:hypothetical protein